MLNIRQKNKSPWSEGKGNDARFVYGLWSGCINSLRVIVVEACIGCRFQTLDGRASIFEFPASIQVSSPLNNFSFNPKANACLPVGRGFLTLALTL